MIRPRPSALAATLLAGTLATASAASTTAERDQLLVQLQQPNLDAEALVALARQLQRVGAIDEADRALQRALGLRPHHPGAILSFGDLYRDHPARWAKQDFLTTLHVRALDHHRGNPRVRTSIALSLAELELAWGRLAEAQARLAELGSGNPSREIKAALVTAEAKLQEVAAAQHLRPWPDITPTPVALAWLRTAEEQLRHHAYGEALATIDRLLAKEPTWQAALFVRGRTLEALQRHAEAARTYERLLRLAPADGRAQRRLGLLLQQHGGPLAVAAADEALRRALALEPAYAELWLHRAELLLGRGNAREARRALQRYLALRPAARGDAAVVRIERAIAAADPRVPEAPRPPPLPEEALAKLAEVESWLELGDPGGIGRRLLDELVKKWPDFVPAQALRYNLTGEPPVEGEKALWQNGEGLFDLAERVRSAAPASDAQARTLAGRWLDRAIALGHDEALYRRAVLHHDAGQAAPALQLIERYLARPDRPPHTTEAQALRQRLVGADRSDAGERALRQARLRLFADRPSEEGEVEAQALLSGTCKSAATDRRLGIALLAEHRGALREAADCYGLVAGEGSSAAPDRRTALSRLAVLFAQSPALLTPALGPLIDDADRDQLPAAALARAVLAESAGDDATAARAVERFLAEADPEAPGRDGAAALLGRVARRARERSAAVAEAAQRRRDRWELGLFAAGATSIFAVLVVLGRRRRTLRAALQLRPALFPSVVQAVGAIRHDQLKHRTSALSLIEGAADPVALRTDLAAAILGPIPPSVMVKQVYQTLQEAALALGTELVKAERDPIFGPLVRDLQRCEELLGGPGALAALQPIDDRLRNVHDAALQALLTAGPRTRLTLDIVSRWIAAVRAEADPAAVEPTVIAPPELAFPIDESSLFAIFSNLLRNALAASPGGAVAIRLSSERDPAGRRELVLAVHDSSAAPLRSAAWESSPADRGLGVVRERVTRWRARIVVQAEPLPYRKSVQVRFPS